MHTLPAVACVKHHWPQARVSWVVNPEWTPLLQGNPYVADVIEFPRQRFRGVFGWTRFPQWVRALRERVQPDLALDFQGLFRSALIGRWSGGQVWGTSDAREGARFLHHRVVQVPRRFAPVHAVTRMMKLVEALGCPVPEKLEWPLPGGAAPRAELPRDYVLLHPFSRGSGKSLRPNEVTAFCRTLAPRPVVVVGRSDVRLGKQENVTNLLNATSLPELCWLIRHAAFTVSVDSGPMHIASALTERLLAIHTWTEPRRVGPFQPNAWIWKDGRIRKMNSLPPGDHCSRPNIGTWVAAQLQPAAK